MKKECPEKMYDYISKSGIANMPGRRFPVVAIKGDSLSNMLTTALELMEKGKSTKTKTIFYGSMVLAERLRDHLAHYGEVLEEEGFKKTYSLTAKQLEIVDIFENS